MPPVRGFSFLGMSGVRTLRWPVGILHAALPASADVRNGVAFVRLAEVAAARLTGLDAAAIADLKSRHLIVR